MGFKSYKILIMLFSLVIYFGQDKDCLVTINTNLVDEIKLQVEIIQEELIKEIEIQKEIDELEEEIEIEVNLVKFKIEGLKLKEGTASEEVFKVIKFLKEKGYTDIVENYYYDNKIKEIVARYQEENDLIVDGIVGKGTYEKINEDIERDKIIISDVELNFIEASPERDWIIINKSNNTLYHLIGEEIIGKYPVATGKNVAYTPEGKFTVVSKAINPSWGGAGRYTPVRGGDPKNPLGKRWMGLSINGGGTYGIHGNSNEESIGTFASLGCIRMFNEDVEFLYDFIPKGTPVWIGNETRLKEYGVLFDFPYERVASIDVSLHLTKNQLLTMLY